MKKKIIYGLLILLFVGILIYDTYYVHFKRKINNDQDININIDNDGTINYTNISSFNSYSINININNKSLKDEKFKIGLQDIDNNLNSVIYYELSKDNLYIIDSNVMPNKDSILLGDIIKGQSEEKYTFKIYTKDIMDVDIGKKINGKIKVIFYE